MKEIGYLGDNNAHRSALTKALAAKGVAVHALNPSTVTRYGKDRFLGKFRSRLGNISDKMLGTRDPVFKENVNRYFKEFPVRLIVAYWGTNVFPDVIAIKKERPDIRIILNVLCHPMGLSNLSVAYQNAYFKLYSRYFDGFVFSNNVMKEYMHDTVGIPASTPSVIVPPLLSLEDLPSASAAEVYCGAEPSLCFLGRTDWWAAQKSDNVTKYLDAIVANGIDLHYCRNSRNTEKTQAHRHLFEPMKMKELGAFIRSFDASLILYNLEECQKDDRFRVTIPDRLMSSVSFGIPVAIPSSGYDGCREFLREYGAVIEFDSIDHLKEILDDRGFVNKLKIMAHDKAHLYCMERYVDRLELLFDQVCSV